MELKDKHKENEQEKKNIDRKYASIKKCMGRLKYYQSKQKQN